MLASEFNLEDIFRSKEMECLNFFGACRRGDINSIKEQLSDNKVDPNIHDQYDNSPLYLACLCGHENIVQFLLQNGAKYDPDSPEGDRIYKGALTDSIRRALKEHVSNAKNSSSNHMPPDVPAYKWLKGALKRMLYEGHYANVTLAYGNKTLALNKFVLQARCPKLSPYLEETDIGSYTSVEDMFSDETSFCYLMEFLYTACIPLNIDQAENVCMDARNLDLHSFAQQFQKKIQRIEKCTDTYTFTNPFLWKCAAQEILSQALQGIPVKCRKKQTKAIGKNAKQHTSSFHYDVEIDVRGVTFKLNKFLLMEHPECSYFVGLIKQSSRIGASERKDGIIKVQIDTFSSESMADVLLYLFEDSYKLPEKYSKTVEVYEAARICQIKRLHAMSLEKLRDELDMKKCFSLYKVARDNWDDELTDMVINHMARNMKETVDHHEFTSTITEEENEKGSSTFLKLLIEASGKAALSDSELSHVANKMQKNLVDCNVKKHRVGTKNGRLYLIKNRSSETKVCTIL